MAGRTRLQFKKQTLEGIAYLLGGHVDRPVIDATGLKGWYAFTLSFNTPLPSAPNADDAGLSVFAAVTQQLGLRLAPTKGPINFLVIDRVERRPTEN